MSLPVAATALLGILGAANLALTLWLATRLRDQANQLAELSRPATTPWTGMAVGDFTTSSVDGEPVSRDLLREDTLVAFLDPACAVSEERLTKLVTYARAVRGGRCRVLAVVVGEAPETEAFVDRLRPVARVVTEPDHTAPLGTAFRVAAYPVLLRVATDAAGKLVVTSNSLEIQRVTASR
ncbi:thioredoxin domain-containing protein [Plantactinospora endophytica]|nr:hypothetical protein [Plantactinospora endophytica]